MKILSCIAFILFLAELNGQIRHSEDSADPFGWEKISSTARPSTFWWWLGSSVNEKEIERQLVMLKKAGFGGVTVCPLYEYENPVIPPIRFLSDRWVGVFRFTLMKARELDMNVDVTMVGGWPLGGPWITRENTERKWMLEVRQTDSSDTITLRNEEGKDPVYCVTLLQETKSSSAEEISNDTYPARVVEPVKKDGKPEWHIPPGRHSVLIARMGYGRTTVYVGSEGGRGPVFDYWSDEAFSNLVEPLEKLYSKPGDLRPRSVYCDSFEGNGGTTPLIFDKFEEINGYDLRLFLHQFLAETGTPENVRLWHDYRQTIAALHVEFVRRWTKWADEKGMTTRYQFTGDPANPVNTCFEAGIPEDSPPFNVSAAHLAGKKLISAEEYTWGAGHNFKDYNDYYRKRGDLDLMEGLNHKIYHGTPFTPLEEPWPGPMYYAGGNFSETQPFFRHIKYLNGYFARLQHILQESEPQADVLLLWSIHDFWNMPNVGGFNWGQPFVWRNSNSAMYREDVKENTRKYLVNKGIQTDICSEEIISERTSFTDGRIKAGAASYRILVIPETKMVATGTLKKIEELSRNGATVIFVGNIPVEAPAGLPLVQDMTRSNSSIREVIKAGKSGNGRILFASGMDELQRLLAAEKIEEDGIPGKLKTLRVKQDGKIIYLIRNITDDYLDVEVPLMYLSEGPMSVVAGNPRTSVLFIPQFKVTPSGKKVRLVFEPSELLVVKEIQNTQKPVGTKLLYGGEISEKSVSNRWKLQWETYEGQNKFIETDSLKLWTEIPEIGLYSGQVSYKTSFMMKGSELKKRWILDAGNIYESAEVLINGKEAGCLWTTPFKTDITRFLKKGENIIVLEVVNKAQNRIVEMERKGVKWQKSKLEEVSDDRTTSGPLRTELLKPVPSGLIGPVGLIGIR